MGEYLVSRILDPEIIFVIQHSCWIVVSHCVDILRISSHFCSNGNHEM